jgi:hypothetical protein
MISLCVAFCLSDPALADSWIEVKGGDWSPSPEILGDIQKNLERYVRENANYYHRGPLKRWDSYVFQFQGRQTPLTRRRFIFVNAVCNIDSGSDLSARFIEVLDGGTCYFSLKYDPEKKEFYDLLINGVA